MQSCEKEEKLEDLFTLGLGSLTSGDYEQAKTALKEAINIRPEYAKDGKTAISLLQQAVERRKPVTISSRWGFRIILTIIILITFFWGFSPSSPLFPILFPVTPTTYLIITNAISETSIPTSTATEILTTTSTLEFTNTTTPTSTIASFTTPEPFRNNIPLLTFDRNTSISGICWFNETNSISELSASGGFSRRTDGNWRFGIEAGRTTDEYIQTDFNQCFGQNGVGAIAFNAWIARLELERNSPDIPGEIVPGKEFGFFIENSENQRREYTVWVDKNDNMHLRVRENSEIISDDIILIVTPESLRISGAFPRLYSEFPIQFFFEINNQGLDILYLIQGPGQLEVRAESLNSNNMIRIDNSVKPTLGNIHKIGLIGYGGETQVILFPIVFFEGTADIVTPNPPTPLPTIRPTITITANPNFTPTPTETTLGFGYINKGFVSIWAEPNAGLLGSLTLNHPLTLLELKEVAGSNWYRCRWELDANIQEGWILGSNITFGLPPTPRP